jgi:hypothetical protein
MRSWKGIGRRLGRSAHIGGKVAMIETGQSQQQNPVPSEVCFAYHGDCSRVVRTSQLLSCVLAVVGGGGVGLRHPALRNRASVLLASCIV